MWKRNDKNRLTGWKLGSLRANPKDLLWTLFHQIKVYFQQHLIRVCLHYLLNDKWIKLRIMIVSNGFPRNMERERVPQFRHACFWVLVNVFFCFSSYTKRFSSFANLQIVKRTWFTEQIHKNPFMKCSTIFQTCSNLSMQQMVLGVNKYELVLHLSFNDENFPLDEKSFALEC